MRRFVIGWVGGLVAESDALQVEFKRIVRPPIDEADLVARQAGYNSRTVWAPRRRGCCV